ncbi:FtsH protease activity modulator HflK [Sutterella sp.]|uniref:FtsH protease activity modulator HflK n=1 Tax=Sutterella sp. TaxID=1981025 RepID=UPI0026E05E87|nr:FtsH protease activity modulator HflK [Sutterella sp.]MDO5530569.1 FtsH protease activity modulator HflK [Sutterella sp.]
MSLNDPRWGRGSSEPQKENEEDREARDRADAENERGQDDQARGGEDARDERKGRPETLAEQTKRENREREEDLDRLWGEFTNLINTIMNPAGQSKGRGANDQLSKLKSRDDFSRDDEEPRREERPQEESRPQYDSRDDRRDERREERRDEQPRQGGAGSGGRGTGGGFMGRSFPKPPVRMPEKGGNIGVGVLALCVLIGWAVSGFYIVPEGQTGVVTTFGRYEKSAGPGFNWHIPAPIQQVELVDVSSVRTTQIGMRGTTDRLREALMLTDDENIVDVQFNVQYRIKSGLGAKEFLFNTRAPDTSVTQAAESAMREVVGRKTMDSVLFESKAEIAEAVKNSMQTMLDRYGTGIEVMSVAIQNAQPPEQVQAAFNDAVKAGQDRERSINLGEAYMNAVIPKAQGTASRLTEEAEGYKARVTEMARGDADRFSAVFTEYRKAPEVTRDRIYLDTMREIYSNVSKIYVDQQSGSNLLYLPLDKIVAATQTQAKTEAEQATAAERAYAALLVES